MSGGAFPLLLVRSCLQACVTQSDAANQMLQRYVYPLKSQPQSLTLRLTHNLNQPSSMETHYHSP